MKLIHREIVDKGKILDVAIVGIFSAYHFLNK